MSINKSTFNRETKFARWVIGIGITVLLDELRKEGQPVTVSAVYMWLRGETTPKPKYALAIERIAIRLPNKPKIKLSDIYSHIEQEERKHEPSTVA